MSKTDELRAMLDERGVEWEDEKSDSALFPGFFQYTYWGDGGGFCFCEPHGAEDGTLGSKCDFSAIGITPAQAVAATLGSGDAERWRGVALGLFASLEEADLNAAQRWIAGNKTLREELAYGDSPAATPGPGTCRNVVPLESRFGFQCSECGTKVDVANMRAKERPKVNVCPNCRREVTG